ncbi:MAG: adenosylcobinamide-phosphate synthase CbiB [Pseudomonadota bacterium]
MLAAWAVEVAVGWPDRLYGWIRHPVVWLGSLIDALEGRLNRATLSNVTRYALGAVTTLLTVGVAAGAGILVAAALPPSLAGFAVLAVLSSSLLASRSLHQHVAAVAKPLIDDDTARARLAVSRIVGRDPALLDEAGIARASLESLAENASDGVVAPLFWGAVLGLPGLAGYKAINTLDSMIGHRNDRFEAFGGFAARLDDLANLLPARLTALLFAAAAGRRARDVLAVVHRDASSHRSPNAGWPESALAGVLAVRLSGPRRYGDTISEEPWLNGEAPDPSADDIVRGLRCYRRALAIAAATLTLVGMMAAAIVAGSTQ